MIALLDKILVVFVLVLGFGFVVFFHELGHFLAAKYVGVKVDQFAVGFGQAVCSWRRGLGFVWGSTAKKLAEAEKAGRDTSKFGETEYRINWMPLGGYVKMLGQDDMDPTATSEDPRSFNRKSIAARMLVVSAGVIMNVILAAVLFMALFMWGYRVPAARVGIVSPGSPAQAAKMDVGDDILQHYDDFGKVKLDVALVRPGQDLPLLVRRPDGKEEWVLVKPQRSTDARGLFEVGIGPSFELSSMFSESPKDWDALSAEAKAAALAPDEVVAEVEGKPVARNEYYKLYEAAQKAAGRPVTIKAVGKTGESRYLRVHTSFTEPFARQPLSIGGMEPLAAIGGCVPESAAKGHLLPGDIVTSLEINGEIISNPSVVEFRRRAAQAGADGKSVVVGYVRDGKEGKTPPLKANVKLDDYLRGLGVVIRYDSESTRVSNVVADSAAARAQIPRGARILEVNGQDVTGGWFSDGGWDAIYRTLSSASGEVPVKYEYQSMGKHHVVTAALNVDLEKATLAKLRFEPELALPRLMSVRQTNNPLTAASWGAVETRDMLLQMYVQLHRLVTGSVPASNAMGPLGIVREGSRIAFMGYDKLIWFLAMISANLAVVNFLPIPIVDGGLFLFLILEKIQGKPLSPGMQRVAQIVGLAIILSVFVFVTYNDIARIFG